MDTIVTEEFTYFDDGCFPTVHAVGETVTGEVAEYAISQGFADEAAEPATDPSNEAVGETVTGEVKPAKRGRK